ncbi:MAG TPA: ABC transporter substrate-binding protein [Aeromicrobium sp.]|nr:ABC transporter substrate-binding protein [Aeromicrobium sp.]
MKSHTQRRARRSAVIAAVAAAAMLLAACGGGGSAGAEADTAKNADGSITIGTMFPPGTLDPTTGTQGSDLAYLDYIFDRLIQQDPDTGELTPMLATSWEFIGDDKLILEVKLREGVTFQDGTPFNAQAVVDYSKDFIEAGNIANLLQYVTDITAEDDLTVRYHLSQQNARLPMALTARAGMIPSPTAVEKEGEDFALHPVGTGPFKFVSQVQGASYKFERYDGYWNNENLDRAKNVEFKIFQSDTALVNGIRSNDVDVALHLLSQDVKILEPIDTLHVEVSPGPAIGIAYLNASLKPLDDPRVRLAFNLALDRTAIADTVTDGLGEPVTQSLPPGAHGYIEGMDPLWEQDVDRAKQLMDEAGYDDGVKMTCFAYSGLGFETGGPIIIDQLKQIGIDLTIVPATAAQVGPFFTNKTDEQCAFANWGATEPFKAYQLLWSQSYYNAGKVDFGIDDDIAGFYAAYDQSSEEDLVRSILTKQKEQPGWVPIFRAPVVDVYQDDIGGWVPSKLGIGNVRGIGFTS